LEKNSKLSSIFSLNHQMQLSEHLHLDKVYSILNAHTGLV